MADKKISELTSITGTSVSDTNDTIAIVDSSAGQTKKITREELFNSVDGANFTGDVLIQETFDVALTLRSNSSTDARIKFIRPAGSSYEFANEAGEFRLKRGTSGATDTFDALQVSSGSKWRFYDPSNGTELARMQPTTSGLPTDNTIVTRVTGDARYAQLSGAEFTGDVDVGELKLRASPANTTGDVDSASIRMDSFKPSVFYKDKSASSSSWLTQVDGGIFDFFRVDSGQTVGTRVARLDGEGSVATFNETVITREKGDARYLPERGSNANGKYVRFPDGTQICTSPPFSADATTAVGSLYKWASNQTWTYPAVFSSAPNVSPAATNNTSLVAAPATVTTTSVSINVLNAVSVAGRSATFVAIGRWF